MPLRLRLTALLVALMTAAMLITGLVATYQLRSFLLQRQDAELQAAKTELVAAATSKQGTKDRDVPAYVPTGTYVVRLRWQGGAAQDFLGAANAAPAWPPLTPNDPHVKDGRPFTVGSLQGDGQWRLVAGTIPGHEGTYAVAVSLRRVDDIVERLILVIGTAEGLLLISCGVLGWFLVRRAMRPLRDIQNTARAIADGDLTRRITLRSTHDEIGSLSKSLNVMLARIEDSFEVRRASEERMRRFVADASHELRTPLATVRGYAELFRQGAVSSAADLRSAMRRIEDESTRMGVMVDDLLLLTRLERRQVDPDAPAHPFEPVDLTVLGADAVQDAIALDHSRPIRLLGVSGRVKPTMVSGDEAGLRQVVTNLMANAIRYTPPQTPLEVLVGSEDGTARLAVRDHGPGVQDALRERIFERFYRADASRNSTRGGSGLGLAIVSAIMQAHDGVVRLEDTRDGGATFVLELPLLHTPITQQAHRVTNDDSQPPEVE
ncbi:sensor histidine kinase [Leekyejoonella antrihumi]|uniref:histidine kinase n=1 Tax=Leekyejoonella antrihumi TaxID=1660198 RepID=A0A563DZB3_9MICO|nr:HAMP domain-containing sensor histidine kinase [Leekyejoonella antrihumi]TWP35459.1 HAMP domain-containing histidine kinase [Leekyejoonella antrihumi]